MEAYDQEISTSETTTAESLLTGALQGTEEMKRKHRRIRRAACTHSQVSSMTPLFLET